MFGALIRENTTTNDENRALATKPIFNIREIEGFPKSFENYYNDQAPFRNLITEAWANLNFRIFNDSASDSVVVGKTSGSQRETWLFYSSDADFNPIKDVQGLTSFSEDDWNEIVNTAKMNKKTWNKLGTKFYVIVAPSKENIYREYLPNSITIYDDSSRVDKLMERINKIKIENIIYLKPTLLEAKTKDIGQIYYKHDTHWNKLGAFYGYQKCMEIIQPDFNTTDYKVSRNASIYLNKDLSKLLNIKGYFLDYEEEVEYLDNSKYAETEEYYDGSKVQIFKNENAPIKKKILVIGDSYREAMLPYFAKTFSEMRAVHVKNYKTEIAKSFKPDIVLLETVERYAIDTLKMEF